MQVINMQLKNGVTGVRTDTMYLCGKKTPCMVWDYIDGIDFYPCTDSPDNVYSLLCFFP